MPFEEPDSQKTMRLLPDMPTPAQRDSVSRPKKYCDITYKRSCADGHEGAAIAIYSSHGDYDANLVK